MSHIKEANPGAANLSWRSANPSGGNGGPPREDIEGEIQAHNCFALVVLTGS